MVFTRIISKTHLQSRSIGSFTSFLSPSQGLFLKPSQERSTGLFGNESLKDPSGFYVLRENVKVEAERLMAEALSSQRNRKMVQVFDNLSNSLCLVADLAEFVRMGHPQQRFALAAEEASIAVSLQVEQLNTNRQLYQSLKNVIERGDKFPTTELDDFVARLFLFDFEQSGIHLDEEKRRLVVSLNEAILHKGSYFIQNTTTRRSVAKSSLPLKEVRNCFSSDGDDIVVSGLCAESDNELVRESAYRIFLHPDDHQEALLRDLLMSRLRLAHLCGFKSYAERAIRGSIADTPENVINFLNIVKDGIRDLAEEDYQQILRLKRINAAAGASTGSPSASHVKEVFPWDIPYYTAAFKQSQYSQSLLSCAPYFSLGCCLNGLNLIFSSLFNIQLNIVQADSGETWHPEVIKLSVTDNQSGQALGLIYCDFFERTGKSQQDCHFTIQGGCKLPDGSYQNPIVVLMLSLSRPSHFTPSLLTPHQVDNLFHEMGHAIHSMMARTEYQHITGTRCSTDLAEVPSILMEYFASDSRVLKSFAKHYSTGQVIPDDLLSNWISSKKIFSSADTQLQTFYSMLDQVYHSQNPLMSSESTTSVLEVVQNEYYGLKYVPNTAWQLRFGHLVGYGAKYYSYLVSRAVAHSLWIKLFQEDPLSRQAGSVYKKQVLSIGGGKHPREVVQNVLETDVTPKFLAECILKEVKDHRSKI